MSSVVSSIDLHYFCTYLTATSGVKWKDDDYKALFMVKSIKNDEFRGYFDIVVNGEAKRFTQSDSADFRKICHKPLSKIAKDNFLDGVTIVPIPSSVTTKVTCEQFRTFEIGNRLAETCGLNYDCKPMLLFKEPTQSSRKGGSRSPYEIETNLIVNGFTSKNIVLFDDVITLGGHLKAAHWKLTDAGMNVIGAITFAKTVINNELSPFGPHKETVDVTRQPALWD